MRNAWGMVGCGVFLLLTLRQAATYGREWQFGKFCMPASMLAAAGRHYRDGSAIDPFTLALVRSGNEELVELVLVGVLSGCGALLLQSWHRRWQTLKRHCRLKALLDTAKECQRAGRWQEAEEAFQRFETLWAADKRNPPLRRTLP